MDARHGIEFRQYNEGWATYMSDMMHAVVKHVEPYLARNGGSEHCSGVLT